MSTPQNSLYHVTPLYSRVKSLRLQVTFVPSAAVCCPVEAGEDPAGIARYVQAVLEPVFHPAGIAVEVAPLAYQPCGKVPVIITLDGQDPRLLWYYKGMPAEALSEELFWLLFDLPLVADRVPA